MTRPVGRLGRHVLEAVHGEVDLAGEQALLDVLDEDALAADLLERDVGAAVALGADDLDARFRGPGERRQRLGDDVDLAQREGAAAGADDELARLIALSALGDAERLRSGGSRASSMRRCAHEGAEAAVDGARPGLAVDAEVALREFGAHFGEELGQGRVVVVRKALRSSRRRRASAGLAPPVEAATTILPWRTTEGRMKSQNGGSSAALTQMRRARASRGDRGVDGAVVGGDEADLVALEIAVAVLALRASGTCRRRAGSAGRASGRAR